ncbi:MAG: hypothetical protein ACFFAJ_13985 [Candidatus Hodarchaeota archaeon]
MIPCFSLYLALFIAGFIGYIFLALTMGDAFILYPSSILLFFFLIVGTSVFVFESLKMMQMKLR